MDTHIPVFGGVFGQGDSIQAFGLTYGSGTGYNSGSGELSQIASAQFSGTMGTLDMTTIGPSGSRGT